MSRPTRRRAAPTPAASPTDLHRPLPSERVRGLLRERNALLKKIAQKKRSLERLQAAVEELTSAVERRMASLLADYHGLLREIRSLFSELLVPKRLSRQAARKVSQVYHSLMEDLGLDPFAGEEEDTRRETDFDDAADFGAGAGPTGDAESFARGGGYSAAQPGSAPGRESLKALFRRLAASLHPDRVQNADEKSRRTEALKEVTRAYQEGDLARLIEIEQRWTATGLVDPSRPEGEEAEVVALERAIQTLREQLTKLRREYQALRDSPPAQALGDLRRRAGASAAEAIDLLVADAETDVARLRTIRDFVQAFRDGKLSLQEFLAGPPPMIDPDELQRAFAETIDRIIEEQFLAAERAGRARRAKASRGGRRKPTPDDDIPF